MKVGDYIRDSEGEIAKIIKKHEIITEDNIYIGTTYYWKSLKNDCEGCFSEGMKNIKSSPNIIDLIKENDLIKIEYEISDNEKQQEIVQAIRNFQGLLYVNTFVGKFFIQDLEHYNRKILSIVTNEQFESMEYEI